MTDTKTLLKKYNNALIDDILKKIENLKLIDEKDLEKLEKELKNVKKREAPKIPLEKQCKEKMKNGKKCIVAKCYENKCWAHMNKGERENYRETKIENNVKDKSYN